ncbi:MAG: phytoene/squalene synthase family protein [Acidimicrobiales bacterium]
MSSLEQAPGASLAVLYGTARGFEGGRAVPNSTARITLARSFEICRALHRRHGTTYYWACRALPKVHQHHVHALYGLCRYADDIVDEIVDPDGAAAAERRNRQARQLERLASRLQADLAVGGSEHPVLKAVVHTARAFDLSPTLFARFFAAMQRDLVQSRYQTYAELESYMDGSAAVIGEMMLPILEPRDLVAATPGARTLGVAFQLTNFLRDVGEDLTRGRIYFPQDELREFGADPRRGVVDEHWRKFSRFQIARIEDLYREADQGIAMLQGRSRASIAAARRLYAEILDRIVANDHDVFTQRARVPLARKLAVVGMEVAWRG